MEIDFSEKFKTRLLSAERIVFFTGAGISAESGIPTFRGKEGIWNKLKPEELANFDSFIRNPDIVWEWYQYRRKIVSESNPNDGHLAIVEFENFADTSVITQNVDNLHRRAGSKVVYELHGNIEKNYCIDCRKRYDYNNFNYSSKAPICECGGRIRPDIVWFGEYLPQDQYASSEKAAKDCDIIFLIGTSGIVYPAASIPLIAKAAGAYLVEINTDQTELTFRCDISFKGKSGEVLPQILQLLKTHIS